MMQPCATQRSESDTAEPASRAFRLYRLVLALGPYLLIELLLPGGSLIALLLWIHRRIHRFDLPSRP